ncbi:MAG: PHP domain-containing protein [Faecousia sp.]
MPNKRCDLHTHSTFSDGTCTPAEIIEKAIDAGLSAVALTDHNTVAGLPDFLAAARGKPIQAIPGVEISTEYGETELHLVGLFLSPDCFDAVKAYLAPFLQQKEQSNIQLVQAMNRAGYCLDYEQIRGNHPNGTVNRATIASALLEKGYVASIQEAFGGLLSKKSGYYLPPQRPDVFETIAFLRSIHAVPVLAHSFLNLKTPVQLRHFLNAAVPHGLTAMETLYPSYTPETTALARQIAREYGLMESGGSDFHGQAKPHIHLGTGTGSLAVPAVFSELLQKSISFGSIHT